MTCINNAMKIPSRSRRWVGIKGCAIGAPCGLTPINGPGGKIHLYPKCESSGNRLGQCARYGSVDDCIPKADKWRNSINAEEIDMTEDIPSSCLNNIYDVELRAMEDEGAHFVLAAKLSADEKSSDNDKCPDLLTFTSIDEKKFTHRIQDINKFDEDSSSFLLAKASLKEITDAESSVKAIKDSEYDITKNSCVHYAGHIWRKLHFDETNELASFLIKHLLKDDGLLTVARGKLSAGGLRVMSYVKGKGSFEDFVKNTVYSQLNIKDGGEFMTGKICCMNNIDLLYYICLICT